MAADDGPIVPLRPYGPGAMYAGMLHVLRSAPASVVGAALLGFALTALLDSVAGPTTDTTRRTSGSFLNVTTRTRYGPTAVATLDVFAAVAVAAVLVPLTLRLVAGQGPTKVDGRAGFRAGGACLLLGLLGLPEAVAATVGGPAVRDVGGLLAVLLQYVTVRLAVLPAVMAAEQQSVMAGLRRSWSLVRGSWWRTFGLTLMFGLVQTVGGAAATGAGLLTEAHQAPGVTIASPTREAAVGLALLSLLALPMGASCRVLLYVDQRCRSEGSPGSLPRRAATRRVRPSGPARRTRRRRGARRRQPAEPALRLVIASTGVGSTPASSARYTDV